jgi:hypothetical protein
VLEESLDLREGAFLPLDAGEIQGETFDLTKPAEGVDVDIDTRDGVPPDYVEMYELEVYPWVWGVAEVALVQDSTILGVYRLLIAGNSVCTI